MRSHAGVASRMFEALAKESINIQMISTSEIKVSVVIEEVPELAVRALHTAFELDAPARQGGDADRRKARQPRAFLSFLTVWQELSFRRDWSILGEGSRS